VREGVTDTGNEILIGADPLCYSLARLGVLVLNRRVKREAGERPARSRHCKQQARWHSPKPLFHRRNGKAAGRAMTCKSGDLPRMRSAHATLRMRAVGVGR